MFEAALAQMENTVPCWGPSAFQEYCRKHHLPTVQTARFVSVNDLDELQPELRSSKCMVFRLGAPEGEKNTHFGLARCFNDWGDYFLLDDQLFANKPPELFIPPVSFRQLFPFYLLPSFTETSLVNLALASGLMAHALKLDCPELPLATATGQSTFNFEFTPHRNSGVTWNHSKGQVEIDSLFTARRGGKETVFIVESKAGIDLGSLAKHKLFYPIMAIRSKVPTYMPVVPVYLRVTKQGDGYHFYFAECEIVSNDEMVALNELTPVCSSHYVLRLFDRMT